MGFSYLIRFSICMMLYIKLICRPLEIYQWILQQINILLPVVNRHIFNILLTRINKSDLKNQVK